MNQIYYITIKFYLIKNTVIYIKFKRKNAIKIMAAYYINKQNRKNNLMISLT